MGQSRFHLFYFFVAMMGVMFAHDVWVRVTQVETIPYSEFEALAAKGLVEEIQVTESHISGRLREPHAGHKSQFITVRVDPKISEALAGKNVKITGVIPNTFLSDVLSWILPALVFIGIWVLIMRHFARRGGLGGSFMSVGKSKAKIYVETDIKTSFADVAGVDEAKAELQEIVAFLKDPAGYGRLGARMPKGVLLVGPPGTGKTLLAKAVAGEAGVPFFSISGSEFVEMFVGVGAARVRDLFEQARQKAPCIIFIDELDALGRARAASGMPAGGHDEKEQTLNQLLVELDGFDSSAGIVLLAATNRPEILDPALLRAGRFDRQVLVDRPDKVGRAAILKVHMQRLVRLDPALDVEKVAALTTGFTGADLANLVNEAALAATRRKADVVRLDDFVAAIERIVAGLERKNRVLNPREREVVAHHEMGHALVSAALPGLDKVQKVSIIPRGIGALGYTIQRPTEDRYLMTRAELENKIAILLGGRAAEDLVFSEISTGAADDIGRATDIARSIVTRYGMEPGLGNATYEGDGPSYLSDMPAAFGGRGRLLAESTLAAIDQAVRRIVDEGFRRARTILQTNRALLAESAQMLLVRETLDEGALAALFQRLVRPAVATRGSARMQGVRPENLDDPAHLLGDRPLAPGSARATRPLS
jgi:cell division protease FtsH